MSYVFNLSKIHFLFFQNFFTHTRTHTHIYDFTTFLKYSLHGRKRTVVCESIVFPLNEQRNRRISGVYVESEISIAECCA